MAGKSTRKHLKGHDTRSLGPSDSSDSGSDLARPGTDRGVGEPRVRVNADRDADRVVDASEAGLGRGLDQAEEGRLGKTDEEIEKERKKG